MTVVDVRELAGAELAEAELAGVELAEAELVGAELTGAELTGAELAGTELVGTELAGAELTRAELAGTELTEEELVGAELAETELLTGMLDWVVPKMEVSVDESEAEVGVKIAVVAVLEGVLVAVLLELLTAEEEAGQVRSNSGPLLSWLPTIPKLGLGVVGYESWRVYQKRLYVP